MKSSQELIAHFVLRLAIGFTFFYAGFVKVFFAKLPLATVDAVFNAMGITFIPSIGFSYVLGFAEVVIGVLLMIGLFTRIAAWIASAEMVCVILGIGVFLGEGLAPPTFMLIAILGATYYLSVSGSKCWGLDNKLF